jgi:hypothetical protein
MKIAHQLKHLAILLLLTQTFCSNEDPKAKTKPFAYAGADKVVIAETSTTLDGSSSKDEDGTIASYTWEKISGPSGGNISTPTDVTTNITNLTAGNYFFRLTITDNDGNKAKDSLKVEVTNEPYYFLENMDNVTIIKDASENKLIFNGWDGLKNHAYVRNLELNNIGGTTYAFQEMTTDPNDGVTKVMKATILDDDPNEDGTTRAQTSLRFEEATDLEVYHTSHRMYLSPEIAKLEDYSEKIVWFTIVEIWNKHNPLWDGSSSGSARWNIALHKEKGTGTPLHWEIEGEYMQPKRELFWDHENKTIPVPLGQWFTLDVYMKRGEGENGRFTVKIKLDGGTEQTIVDVLDSTIYPGHPELPIYSWQFFKLYLDDVYLDYMHANGKKVYAFYNDFTWHKN